MSGLLNSLKNTRNNAVTVMKGIVGQSGNADTDTNSKWFLGNALVTTGSAILLHKSSPDDLVAKQSIAQDVIINGNILLNSVNEPTDLFMKSITETSIFALLVGSALPIITDRFKSTPVDMACAVALPFAAEMISHGANKCIETINKYLKNNTKKTDTKKITSQEEEKKKLYKIYGAVALAAAIKAGILGNNIMQGSGHTSNALYAASLVNTLKTGWDEKKSNKNNKNVRDSKNVIGILFDGVVSPFMTFGVLGLSKKLNMPDNIATTVGKAVVGGVIASGCLQGLTYALEQAFNTKDGNSFCKSLGETIDIPLDYILKGNKVQTK